MEKERAPQRRRVLSHMYTLTLIFIGCFSHKSRIISGSFAKNDLQKWPEGRCLSRYSVSRKREHRTKEMLDRMLTECCTERDRAKWRERTTCVENVKGSHYTVGIVGSRRDIPVVLSLFTHTRWRMSRWEVGGWGLDPKKCTGRDWGMGSSTI